MRNLIIWPHDHTVTAAEDSTLEVRDGSGTVIARAGDMVRLGGGEVPAAEHIATTEIPDRCGGPYWVTSSEVESVNLEELPNHEDVAPLLTMLRTEGYTVEEPEESWAAFLYPEPGIAGLATPGLEG